MQDQQEYQRPVLRGAKAKEAIKKAQQKGEPLQYYKKAQHTNKNTLDGKHVAKILNSQDDHLPKTISQDLRIAISQARNQKGLNQQQFAKMIEVPKADLNAWQAGRAKPPGNIIVKMEKALGIKLPRPPKN